MCHRTAERKTTAAAKVTTHRCARRQETNSVEIPRSWDLNEAQKRFIESLMDENLK
ncbi:hypothetical protein [Pantoea sp. 1.19]|uniref:hypothetical protein n=1 Tax=Pantoea sp. 1.19 TaxID=1925589 RepID=UPI001480DF5E|nr:hypothetical protein [Pantoea sp. 1.19]